MSRSRSVSRSFQPDRSRRRLRDELLAAGAHRLGDSVDPPLLSLLGTLVVGLVGERERRNALRDQVRAMNAREALGDDRPHAEVERCEGGLLSARALTVVVAADDDAAAPLLGPCREVGIEAPEHEPRAGGDVRPDGESERSVGSHVAGRDVVSDDDQDATLDRLGNRGHERRRDDVATLDDLHTRCLLGRWRRNDLPVVDGGVGRGHGRKWRRRAQLARIRDLPAKRRRRRRRRRAQIDAVIRGPASTRKVAVERPHGDGTRRRRLAHADAGPAGGLEDARPGGQQVRVDAAADDEIEDLPRAGRDREVESRGDGVAAQHCGDDRQILVRGVHRASDAHLSRPRPGRLPHRHDVARRGRKRDQRLERVEIDDLRLVVARARVGGELDPLLLSLLGGEPAARLLVAREDPGRRARLHDHVADRPPVRRRQRRHALAEELEDAPPPAAHPAPAQKLEHDVLRLHPGLKLAPKLDAEHERTLERIRPSGHGDRDLGRTRSDRKHSERARHRGVAVRTQQHVSGTREPFEVQVVGDAVSRTRVEQAVALGERAQVDVVVRVSVVELDDVVIHVRHREGHAHAVEVEPLELEAGHGARRVLEQHLVDAELDLLARASGEVLVDDLPVRVRGAATRRA